MRTRQWTQRANARESPWTFAEEWIPLNYYELPSLLRLRSYLSASPLVSGRIAFFRAMSSPLNGNQKNAFTDIESIVCRGQRSPTYLHISPWIWIFPHFPAAVIKNLSVRVWRKEIFKKKIAARFGCDNFIYHEHCQHRWSAQSLSTRFCLDWEWRVR